MFLKASHEVKEHEFMHLDQNLVSVRLQMAFDDARRICCNSFIFIFGTFTELVSFLYFIKYSYMSLSVSEQHRGNKNIHSVYREAVILKRKIY